MHAKPPGPPALPLIGHMLEFRRDLLGLFQRGSDRYGDVTCYRLGRTDVYFLRHPDHVKDVLVTHQHSFVKGKGLQWARQFLGDGLLTSEGDFHTRQRRLAQPAFHKQRIAAYGAAMTHYAERASGAWKDGAVIEVDREMMALTLAIAARTLLDAELTGEAAEVKEALDVILAMFPRFALPFAPLLKKLPLPSNRRFAQAVLRLDEIVYRIIRERRASGEDRGDLLSMLLLAQDAEGDGTGMTDRQLRDEVMTILLAGHETTANALTWTLYLLSCHPEAETRMRDELRTVLAGRTPTVEDLPGLAYTERVFAESLRLFPPAWGFGRRAVRDFQAGEYTVPAGAFVSISPFVVHRDPRWWPDPERFEPDRFLPEAKAARPKFAYFPFSAGKRQCIGEGFAWMEGVLVLATLVQRWRMRLVPGHPVAPQPLITLRPRYGMRMTAEAVSPAP